MDPSKIQPNKGEGMYISPEQERKAQNLPPEQRREFARVWEKEEKKKRTKKEGKGGKEKKIAVGDKKEEHPTPSIFDLVQKDEKKRNPLSRTPLEEPLDPRIAAKDSPLAEEATTKSKERPVFAQEQPDIAAINPTQAPTIASAENVSAEQPRTSAAEMKELIDQLVDAVTTVKTEGKSDTILTLKSPLFNGAQVKVSAYDFARGEFNIAFTNLTQEAKSILDVNLNTLRLSMEQKGHVLHMITTSAQIEKSSETQTEYFGHRDREGDDQRGEGGQSGGESGDERHQG